MKFFFSFSLCCVVFFVYSQREWGYVAPQSSVPNVTGKPTDLAHFNSSTNRNLVNNILSGVYKEGVHKEIKGSPYLFKDWTSVLVFKTAKGKVFKLENVNFNKFNQKFSIKTEQDSIYEFGYETIEPLSFKTPKEKIKLKRVFINKDNDYKSVVSVLYDGKNVSLFKLMKAKINEGSINPLTGAKLTSDSFVDNYGYYLFQKGRLEKIKLKEKSFKKNTSNFKELLAYSKKNKLSFKKEEDVVEILDYYNSLKD